MSGMFFETQCSFKLALLLHEVSLPSPDPLTARTPRRGTNPSLHWLQITKFVTDSMGLFYLTIKRKKTGQR